MRNVQILYPKDKESDKIARYFEEESRAMQQQGFIVGTSPHDDAEIIIKRGFTIDKPEDYPSDGRMIQGWDANRKTLDFSEFADVIKPWAIPFVVIPDLSDEIALRVIMRNNGWERSFIRNKSTSLFALGDYASVYPDTSLNEMTENFNKLNPTGPFIVRKYIDDMSIFYDEQRYWILNGNPYHPSGIIPDMVGECAKRMYKFSGSHYFVIDVAGDYIVEINPGESSDRGGDNPLKFFTGIFAKEFLGLTADR